MARLQDYDLAEERARIMSQGDIEVVKAPPKSLCTVQEAKEDEMPMNAAMAAAGVFSPEEVATLNQIYLELSLAPGFPAENSAREALAQRILFQYQAGVVEPTALKEACAMIR